ncbi:MAG: hypothetical protein J6M48_06295 [Ruminococcus sp.]|nr:hypothetical protein [Ruminococcus sp.]
MDNIITMIINNGSAIALLAYFIYKDNKFTETITKALTSIEESLEIIKESLKEGKDEKRN